MEASSISPPPHTNQRITTHTQRRRWQGMGGSRLRGFQAARRQDMSARLTPASPVTPPSLLLQPTPLSKSKEGGVTQGLPLSESALGEETCNIQTTENATGQTTIRLQRRSFKSPLPHDRNSLQPVLRSSAVGGIGNVHAEYSPLFICDKCFKLLSRGEKK